MYKDFFKPLFLDIKNFILDILFPVYCLVCEKQGEDFICPACQLKLKKLEHQFCIICKKPSIGGLTHQHCKTPYAPEGLISMLDYKDEAVADVLIKGKYKFVEDVYKTLGEMLFEFLKTDCLELLASVDALAPLPLHKRRLRWRGFNQAESLCQSLSEKLGFPVIHALQRTKATKTQKDLKKEQRITNVENAFALSSNFQKDDLIGACIILIDDVTTTGSTLLEAAKVLKQSGAKAVYCLTVARD